MKKRIAKAIKNIIANEIKIGKKSRKVNFMELSNYPGIWEKLEITKNRYIVEDEIMENDEY